MSAFFEFASFFKHLIISGGKHSVHSPYVFELLTQVISSRKKYYCFKEIEQLRSELLVAKTNIHVDDFGAGTRSKERQLRNVSAIAKNALQKKQCAQILFKMVAHYQPKNILELGTSLGITTSYLARANALATVTTIEGSDEIATIAKEIFAKQNIKNIQQLIGNFDFELPTFLSQNDSIDFVLIDGNHRLTPTLKYFEWILERCNENSIIILDDIHWSKEMNQAWQQIVSLPSVIISIDFFHFGMVHFKKGVEKQHFILRLPA